MSIVKIAHLSDPHFGTVLPRVEEALVRALQAIKPNAVIITGDITQRARKSQFQAARAFKEKLQPIPVHAVPGNHDVPLFNFPARVLIPYFGFEKYFHRKKEAAFLVGGIEVIALDSTSPWRHVQGRFTPASLRAKVAPCEKGVRLRIAAFHHPMDCASPSDEKNLLHGRHEVLPVLEELGFDIVLGGHIHDPHVNLSDTRYPEARRPIVLVTAGTCLSTRTRMNAPNSFHLLEADTADEASLKITCHELNKEGAFSAALVHKFKRGTDRSWNYGEDDENQSPTHPGERRI